MTVNNTLAQKAARRKLNLLELADDLGNVSEACRRIGYSREQFYEIRRNYQTFGSRGLLDKLKGPKNPHPNRASEEQEKTVLEYCLEYPVHGTLKIPASGRFTQKSADTPLATSTSSDDPVATLKKLKDMLDLGLIEQSEFDAKKAEIMNRM